MENLFFNLYPNASGTIYQVDPVTQEACILHRAQKENLYSPISSDLIFAPQGGECAPITVRLIELLPEETESPTSVRGGSLCVPVKTDLFYLEKTVTPKNWNRLPDESRGLCQTPN